jgi:hypothetical protein
MGRVQKKGAIRGKETAEEGYIVWKETAKERSRRRAQGFGFQRGGGKESLKTTVRERVLSALLYLSLFCVLVFANKGIGEEICGFQRR